MPGVHLTHREFGKWRNYLWPVHNYELKKLIPMLLIFFLIYFDFEKTKRMKVEEVIHY